MYPLLWSHNIYYCMFICVVVIEDFTAYGHLTNFNTNFKDAHTGLWAYKINLFKKIKLKSLPNSFNFDQKIRISLIKNNLKIKEIPIQTIYADERSQLHIIYAIKFFLITLFYFFRLNYFFNK